jgi:DNA-binding NtrC family response regulator
MARILLAEDFESVRRLLTNALALDGHIVTSASNGAEAIAVFIDRPHDLVITDMEMPYVSGQALIAEIQHIAPSTPIIGMTGGPFPESIEDERQRLNIAALFVKPMDLGTLRQTIHDLVADKVPITNPAA